MMIEYKTAKPTLDQTIKHLFSKAIRPMTPFIPGSNHKKAIPMYVRVFEHKFVTYARTPYNAFQIVCKHLIKEGKLKNKPRFPSGYTNVLPIQTQQHAS